MLGSEYLPSNGKPLVAVDRPHRTAVAGSATRIRVLGPWLDRTAGLLLESIKTASVADRAMCVDLRECSHADTAQLAVLILGQRYARQAGATLTIDGPCELRELATICRIADILNWAPAPSDGISPDREPAHFSKYDRPDPIEESWSR